jgi:succinyl-CoA synthetase alpha subunit
MAKHSSLIQWIRERPQEILLVGVHDAIVQSILDFDYLTGKTEPSVRVMISDAQRMKKYFWGNGEILIRVVSDVNHISNSLFRTDSMRWCLNVASARRALQSSIEVMRTIPELIGGVVFAENMTEQHTLLFSQESKKMSKVWIGPSSVGLVVPGYFKIGAIGGVTAEQIEQQGLLCRDGKIAVISASGGMVGELLSIVRLCGHEVSFALSYGGDRFPLTTPLDAYHLAQDDPQTKAIVYYGELGGEDEYELIEGMKKTSKPKPFVAHIAGTVADLFPESPQFGHAKAKARLEKEKAVEKRKALRLIGCKVSDSFDHFIHLIKTLPL